MWRLAVALGLLSTASADAPSPSYDHGGCEPTHGADDDHVGLLQSRKSATAADARLSWPRASGGRVQRRIGNFIADRMSEPDMGYQIRNRQNNTNYHTRAQGNGSCSILAGSQQMGLVRGSDEAFFWATDSGSGAGTVGGKCDVSIIEGWAQWDLKQCSDPGAWAYVWQGPTSVTQKGYNFVGASGKVKVPSKPQAQGVNHTYFLFLLGMQPELQPGLANVTKFCDLEGDPTSIVYNSGTFARVVYRSNYSEMFGFNDNLFNIGKDWNDDYLMASNFLLGKSSLGPTWGYGSVVDTGEWVSLEATNSAADSWLHELQVEGTGAKVSFSYNSSVFENVFLNKAIDEGIITKDSPEAKLVTDKTWTWSVGPVYEWTVVSSSASGKAPPLEQIPDLWPREPIEWRDFEFQIENGGTFMNYTNKTDNTTIPWEMLFGEGLEVTGSAFGGRLFVDYGKLTAYFEELEREEEKPDDYRQQVCLYKCIMNRYQNSKCTSKRNKRGNNVYDCTTQWGEDFPPKECTAAGWPGNGAD